MNASRTRPLALVTGASSGIGLGLAKQFAAAGFDLVVAAEDPELQTATTGLQAGSEGSVEAVQCDLRTDAGVDELWRRVEALGRPLDAAALNAGIGQNGAFADIELADDLEVVDLNVRGTVHLAKHVVRQMAGRRQGRILFTSSVAATQPGAFQATYNASKSFVQSFGLALREELSDSGVSVTLLMPGPTDTEFFGRADLDDTRLGQGKRDDPREVAEAGFEALMKGEERVVAASAMSKAQGRAGRFMPDSVKAKVHAKLAKPGSGEKQ